MQEKFYTELSKFTSYTTRIQKVEFENARILDSIIEKIPSRINNLEIALKNKLQTEKVIKVDEKRFEKIDALADKQLKIYQKLEDDFVKAKQKAAEAEKLLDRYIQDRKDVRNTLDKIQKEALKYDKEIDKSREVLNDFSVALEKQLNAFIANAKKLGVDVNVKQYTKILTNAKKALTKSK